jgi:hypothetical protein
MWNADNLPWLNNCQAAISLSFDDGREDQLTKAIPILKEYDLLATFYINPRGDNWQEQYTPWRKVAETGHEIGNHTINHICSRNFAWGDDPKGLEVTTLEEIEADVIEAERRLNKLIPGHPERTFCYPCYQNYVGEGPTRQSYVPIIAKYFPAARGMGEAANHPLYTDLHYLASCTVAGWMSGSDLCGFAKKAVETKRWAILTFHSLQEGEGAPWFPGESYHGSPLPVNSFRELCEYLDGQRQKIWTAPVIDVAKQVIKWRGTL